MTGIDADIPCINLTPNRYNALTRAIVYFSNDVTITINSMMSQMKPIAKQNTLLWAHLNGTEIVLKSTDRR